MYLAAVCGVIHLLWSVKGDDLREPAAYGSGARGADVDPRVLLDVTLTAYGLQATACRPTRLGAAG